MKRVNSILFVADGSGNQLPAYRRALRLAGDHRASLTILQAPGAEYGPRANEEAPALAESPGGAPDMVEEPATPDAIARLAEREQFDLIIKAAGDRSRSFAGFFNDPDADLVRAAPCPVWLIKPSDEHDRPNRILAAVNPISTNPGSQGLAPQVLDVAAALAESEQGELHIVNTWHVAAEAMLRGRPIHVSDVRRLLRQIRAAHEKHLDKLLEEYNYDKTTVHVHKGRPDKVIRRLLRQREFDDIVIGMKTENGALPLIRSGMAEKILRIANCSVFAVKPA